MNKTKIEWCDATINPVVGCLHNCPYCYARRQARRRKNECYLCYEFIPHDHLERLKKN
jgi:DNA repair photolyase